MWQEIDLETFYAAIVLFLFILICSGFGLGLFVLDLESS
jgi:hypothetical protein